MLYISLRLFTWYFEDPIIFDMSYILNENLPDYMSSSGRVEIGHST
jgi:hypothetical protein